jgi:pimeloyl-ACP methyl ester carboxylesterase
MTGDLYTEGVRIARTLQDLDGPNVNPVCHTRLYTHGKRVERSLVLLHGFTSCPQQFDALGRQFHEQGWNVLIPRYPRHGYADRLNTSIAELRADHLVALANRAAVAGTGLGERLTVAGLSLGGVLTGYLAQTRRDVERAVLIAPMLGLQRIPGPAMSAVRRLVDVLPNFYVWWDARLKDGVGPPHAYPRFASRSYAALLEVGERLMTAARQEAPRAGSIAVITNAAEPQLDNRFTHHLIEQWRKHGAHVDAHEFARSENLPHDLIDPGNVAQNNVLVYPVVSRLIDAE